jgi:Uma2 family endonuclease
MPTTKLAGAQPSTSEQTAKTNGVNWTEEPRSEDGRIVSEELYWAEYYDRGDYSYEWNNGRLEEKPVSDHAQFQLYLWFLALLKDYLHVQPIARMIGLEVGFRMALPRKTTIRKPDLGVVLNSNPVPLGDKDRSYQGIFDLCIESLSDSSKREVERDTVVKKKEYAAAGVTEYFIIDETGSETAFYRLNRGVYIPIPPEHDIIRSAVLPGFQFRVADLYRLPQPPEMIQDSVYQDFVSPFLRAERIRAEQLYERAEQEYTRAERYATILKELGVSLDDLNPGPDPEPKP